MFLKNKYSKWYYSIIFNAGSTKDSSTYLEKHHIIPKSLGGNNTTNNLVLLTPREHFLCHLLLTKMVERKDKGKMCFAFKMMLCKTKKHKRDYRITSRIYEYSKKSFSESMKSLWADPERRLKMSIRMKKQWNNPKYRDSVISGSKKYWEDPEQRLRAATKSAEYWSNPINREVNKQRQIEINKNPDIRASKANYGADNGMFGKTHTPEICLKLSTLASERFLGKSYEEMYGKEKADSMKEIKSYKQKEYRKEHTIAGIKNPNAKSYMIEDPLGKEYLISGGLVKFCKDNKLWIEKIIDVAKGRLDSYKGWKVKYI